MSIDLKLPNFNMVGNPEVMFAQINAYLYSTISELNLALDSLSATEPRTVQGSILSFARSCKNGVTAFATSTITSDLPSNFVNCIGTVNKASGSIAISLTNLSTGAIATRVSTDGVWSRWKYLLPN